MNPHLAFTESNPYNGTMYDFISESELPHSLKSTLNKVCSDHVPLLVKRSNGEDVVIVSREDYASLEETAYLLSSPKNASRLMKAVDDVKEGKNLSPFNTVEALEDAIDS